MAEIDITLRVPKPIVITTKNTHDQKLFYEKWDRVNLMCLYAIRRIVFEHLLRGLTGMEDAKDLYDVVGER